MSQQEISQEQINLLRDIKKQQAYVNDLFKQLDLKNSEVFNNSKQSTSSQEAIYQQAPQNIKDQYTYLKKYQNFNLSRVKKDYEEAFLPFKWYQLPFCRKIIYEKFLFCFPAGAALTVIYLFYKNMQNKKIDWSIRKFGRVYVPITLACLGMSFVESLLTQSYCDINSHHYNNNLSNLQRVKLSKKFLDKHSNQTHHKSNENKN